MIGKKKFVDVIDDSTMVVSQMDRTSGQVGGLVFDSTETEIGGPVSVFLNEDQLRSLRGMIDELLGDRAEAAKAKSKVDDETLAADLNYLVSIARKYPLTGDGPFLLVDSNALNFLKEAREVLEGDA